MAGDTTKRRFNPLNDASGILYQQGRVMLDQDWNELVDVMDRRWRAETVDVIGRAVVPTFTQDGFKIRTVGANDLSIGAGRIYVDGLLAENHGTQPQFDSVLEEMPGTQPLPFNQQPYMPGTWPFAVPNPFVIPTDGQPFLVFLDVWKREQTYLQAPDLVDQAVGVDTATRTQTAWQVKILPDLAAGTTCAAPGKQLGNWLSIIAPSAGQLTTSAAGVPSSTDPCTIPANSGYRGADNRTYRIEIHTPGGLGRAQFKYSRNNASVASPITAINGSVLTVVRTKRDSVLRFSPNDWIEVTDDTHEFAGQPGVMCQILSVDDTNLTISLKPSTPLPAGVFDATQPQLHTRVILWDQHGRVFDTNGNLISDVDANGGLINVPTNATVVLEDGVQVAFGLSSATGQFLVADYWLFVARVIDSSVELLTNAPPRGIHHHFCKLAVVTLPGTPADCRVFWPPDMKGDCECAQCVTADGHNKGTFTIQAAIDLAKSTGGKVCLGPGVYQLRQTLNLSGMLAPVRLTGHGAAVLQAPAADPKLSVPAILIDGSSGVTVEDLFFSVSPSASTQGLLNPGIMVQNSAFITIRNCAFLCSGNQAADNPAIAVGGVIIELSVQQNFIQFSAQDATGAAIIGPGTGIKHLATFADTPTVFLAVAGLYIQNNIMECGTSAVNFDTLGESGFCWNFGVANIGMNVLGPCALSGIILSGLALPGSRTDIIGNEVVVAALGSGIVCSWGPARISDNEVISSNPAGSLGGSGILIEKSAPFQTLPIDGYQIVGNRIAGVGGFGILIDSLLISTIIKQNLIELAGLSGIFMSFTTAAGHLSVAKNQILNPVPNASLILQQGFASGIYLQFVDYLEVEGNIVADVATTPPGIGVTRVGIAAIACRSACVTGNQLKNIGPDETINASAGIAVEGPGFDRADISGNVVRRSDIGNQRDRNSSWRALYLGPLAGFAETSQNTFSPIGEKQFVVASGATLAEINEGLQFVSVRGNYLEGYGGSPMVEINVVGPCLFNDNQCSGLIGSPNGPPFPVAVLSAASAIASNNWLAGGALSILPDSKNPFTAVGNISPPNSPVEVHSGVLPPPWDGLNVQRPF
jgi:hypothetical protein